MEPRSGTRRKLKPRCIVNYLTSRCTGRALTDYWRSAPEITALPEKWNSGTPVARFQGPLYLESHRYAQK